MNRLVRHRSCLGLVVATVAVLLLVTVSRAGEQRLTIPPASPADPAVVQLAVEKGLFFVEQQSMRWWKSDRCSTCHEGGMLLVAANVAKSQGVPVAQDKLDFWTDRWVLVDGLTRKNKEGEIVGLGMWTAPLMYLHRDADREESKPRAEMWTTVIRGSLKSQGEDGLWPSRDIEVTPRMVLALASLEASKIPFPADFRVELAERRTRAEAWIKAHDPQRPEKTESLAAWIAYELERGGPERAKQLLEELESRRNEDGGWGIKHGDPSHTLVTAVVLFALKTGGIPNDNPLVASTQRYLLDRQKADGRWQELGRHFHKDQNTPSDDAWASGYAVAALSLTLPRLPAETKRLFIPDPALVAEVDQLAKSAAEDYVGEPDRSGDPTQAEDAKVKAETYEKKPE
jgi:hypothetical protein